MTNNATQFIQYAIERNVLRFGEFTLKSGRISPYFFNAGLFNTGDDLQKLGRFYAQAIMDADLGFDMLFGPAYKGIPLVTSAVLALSQHHQLNYPYSFNRKEAKDHGEGGNIVGHDLQGRILVIDDVITAGTAIRESVSIIKQHDANVAGLIIALDRQERGQTDKSTIQELKDEFDIPVVSIATLDDLLRCLETQDDMNEVCDNIRKYKAEFGAN